MASGIEIRGDLKGRRSEILGDLTLGLLERLHVSLNAERRSLLARRGELQELWDQGAIPSFREDTSYIREAEWQVPPAPKALEDRRVEITGPTDSKMVINALNSGAKVFLVDFEDANTPTWANLVDGQINLFDATRHQLRYSSPEGKSYEMNQDVAVMISRPRGWHLEERHVLVGGEAISASLFDFGVYVANNGQELLDRGRGPYFYLPKMESYEEAVLWRKAFEMAEAYLGLPEGSIRATALIETFPAAFEMEEILYGLGKHATGLNAGRWDYIFSAIKKMRAHSDVVFPDRAKVTMTAPFMRAYTELLVRTCHKRGAHAIGGMAAFIPSRRDPEVNERALQQVRADKTRESQDGFDGTWVAHPDLVPVVKEVFDSVLEGRPNQLARLREDVVSNSTDLSRFHIEGASVTLSGLRNNIAVTLRYLESWLRGTGAVAIFNLMEDAATAEISRAQIWQWIQRGVELDNDQTVTADLVRAIEAEELETLRGELVAGGLGEGKLKEAARLFEDMSLGDTLEEFLTIPAYQLID